MNSYAPGNSSYNTIAAQFGLTAAQRAYAASQVNDDGATLRNVLSDIRTQARTGQAPSYDNRGTWEVLTDQLVTNPLEAPLESLDNQLGNVAWNIVKNPFVLLLVVGVVVFYLWPKAKKLLA